MSVSFFVKSVFAIAFGLGLYGELHAQVDSSTYRHFKIKTMLLSGLADSETLQNELEVTNIQLPRLVEVGEKFQQRRIRSTQMIEESLKEFDKDIEQILVPQQNKRLDQLARQYYAVRLTRGNQQGFFSTLSFHPELGLSDEQIAEIYKRSSNALRDYIERISKREKVIQSELMDVLTEEQRQRYRTLFGEPFDRLTRLEFELDESTKSFERNGLRTGKKGNQK